jgi:hypothetical protein
MGQEFPTALAAAAVSPSLEKHLGIIIHRGEETKGH